MCTPSVKAHLSVSMEMIFQLPKKFGATENKIKGCILLIACAHEIDGTYIKLTMDSKLEICFYDNKFLRPYSGQTL